MNFKMSSKLRSSRTTTAATTNRDVLLNSEQHRVRKRFVSKLLTPCRRVGLNRRRPPTIVRNSTPKQHNNKDTTTQDVNNSDSINKKSTDYDDNRIDESVSSTTTDIEPVIEAIAQPEIETDEIRVEQCDSTLPDQSLIDSDSTEQPPESLTVKLSHCIPLTISLTRLNEETLMKLKITTTTTTTVNEMEEEKRTKSIRKRRKKRKKSSTEKRVVVKMKKSKSNETSSDEFQATSPQRVEQFKPTRKRKRKNSLTEKRVMMMKKKKKKNVVLRNNNNDDDDDDFVLKPSSSSYTPLSLSSSNYTQQQQQKLVNSWFVDKGKVALRPEPTPIPFAAELNKTDRINIGKHKSYTVIRKGNIVSYVKSYDNKDILKTTTTGNISNQQQQHACNNKTTSMITERNNYTIIDNDGITTDVTKQHEDLSPSYADVISILYDDDGDCTLLNETNSTIINSSNENSHCQDDDDVSATKKSHLTILKRLKAKIAAMKHLIKEKIEKLEKLKRIQDYKQDLNKLQNETLQLKRGCQNALIDLLSVLRKKTIEPLDMGTLLHNMDIDNDLVGYNEEKDTFI